MREHSTRIERPEFTSWSQNGRSGGSRHEWNPISALVAACRELFGNPTVLDAAASLPLRHPVAMTIGWSLLILLVFVPLSTRRHQAAAR